MDRNDIVYSPGLIGRGSVGWINSDGRVYTGSFGGTYVGKVDSSGNIYVNSGLFGGSIVGKSHPPKQRKGGAAYLLLLR